MTPRIAFRLLMVAMIIGIFLTIWVAHSMAQTLCAPLPDMLSRLLARFGEVPIWEGENKTHKTIVTANGDGRWSIIQVAKAGEPACLVAAGSSNKTDAGI